MIKFNFLNTSTKFKNTINIPVMAQSICPKCLESVEIDFTNTSLVNPIVNQPFDLVFTHNPKKSLCTHSWVVKVVMRVGLQEVKPAIFKNWTTPKSKLDIIRSLRTITGCSLIDGKKWVDAKPHPISKDLAEALESVGAVIEWRF